MYNHHQSRFGDYPVAPAFRIHNRHGLACGGNNGVERKLEVIRHLRQEVGGNNEVGNKVVGFLLWLFPLLFRGGGDDGRDGDGDGGHGRGRDDGRVVDENNNVVERKLAVSPLVRGDNNEEVHISVVIHPLPSSILPRSPVDGHNPLDRTDEGNNAEERK